MKLFCLVLSRPVGGGCLSRGGQNFNFFIEASGQSFLLLFQVVVRLEVEPELRRHSKVAAKSQCRVSGDGAAALTGMGIPSRGKRFEGFVEKFV